MNIIFSSLILIGFYLLIKDNFTITNGKVIMSVSQKKFQTESDFLKKLSRYILPKINISEDIKTKYEIMFKTTGIKIPVKEHMSKTIAKSILLAMVFLFLSIITKNMLVLLIAPIIAYANFSSTYKQIKEKNEHIKTSIEKELPKLCSVICSKLSHTENVGNILECFYPIATNEMKEQLDITLADIKTSNVTSALLKFETRIHSPMLSDVCRGLISVSNGNNQTVYFQTKSEEFNRHYENMITLEVEKRPNKILPMQAFIGLTFILALLYPMFTYFTKITNNLG